MPFGYELARVVASPGAQGTYSLDLYYVTADGHTLHIWQTNRSDLAGKDPASDGRPTDVHGRSWRTGSLDGGGHWLARRFADGVTVEVDHTGDIDVAKIVAASLYRDNYPPGSG
jgi:hypothetical protein